MRGEVSPTCQTRLGGASTWHPPSIAHDDLDDKQRLRKSKLSSPYRPSSRKETNFFQMPKIWQTIIRIHKRTCQTLARAVTLAIILFDALSGNYQIPSTCMQTEWEHRGRRKKSSGRALMSTPRLTWGVPSLPIVAGCLSFMCSLEYVDGRNKSNAHDSCLFLE